MTSDRQTATLRIDKWLWHARFFKTRSLAARQVSDGRVRLNGQRLSKPSTVVRPGDVLTFVQGKQVRVVDVIALGQRRGPAPEAQALYLDRSPKPDKPDLSRPVRTGTGRPTKKERRDMDKSRHRHLD